MQLSLMITDVSVHLWRRGGYFSLNFCELRLRRSRVRNARGSGPSFSDNQFRWLLRLQVFVLSQRLQRISSPRSHENCPQFS